MNTEGHSELKKNSSQKDHGPKAAEEKPAAESAVASETDLEIVQLKNELQAAKSLQSETNDKYIRVVAEMENMRRRFEREKLDTMQYSLERVMQDILPVLDAFERAFSTQPKITPEGDDPSMVAGLELVRKQLSGILAKHGLEAIDAKGKPFDPNLHQAIQRIDSEDVETDTVKDEFAKGYKLNGRLLRPTMVSVVVPGTSKDS